MNNKLIQQYGEEILSYRFRSARHKKRMQYEDLDKKLRQLEYEETALREMQYRLGYKSLVPPIQRGWIRFFVLRDDVAVSRQVAFFEGILARINTCDWSHRKDFMVKYRRVGTKKYRVKTQKLLEPVEHQFVKLGFSKEEQQLFHVAESYDVRTGKLVKRFVFNEPWRFRLQVKPNMVGMVKIIDEELEAKIRGIRNWIEQNNYHHRQMRVVYGNLSQSRAGYEKPWERNPLKNKSLVQILNELEEDV